MKNLTLLVGILLLGSCIYISDPIKYSPSSLSFDAKGGTATATANSCYEPLYVCIDGVGHDFLDTAKSSRPEWPTVILTKICNPSCKSYVIGGTWFSITGNYSGSAVVEFSVMPNKTGVSRQLVLVFNGQNSIDQKISVTQSAE